MAGHGSWRTRNMEILFSGRSEPTRPEDEEEREADIRSMGETCAVALVCLLVLSATVVGAWSAFLLLTGKTGNGGPVGLVFNLLRATVSV